MTAVVFDTHAYVKHLTQVGVPEPQAEVHAEAIASLIESELATKRDLKEMEVTLRHELKELESRIIIRLGGLIIASVAGLGVLMKIALIR